MSELPLDEMARTMKALSNKSRLELLTKVRTPRRLSEIQVHSTRQDDWGDARTISRQAVRTHLNALLEIGAVTVAPGSPDVRYVLERTRLYELTEQLRQIARLQVSEDHAAVTNVMGEQTGITKPDAAHLVVVRGVEEGTAIPLPSPYPAGGYVIGRDSKSNVRLDHDRYVSGAHAQILHEDGLFFLLDLATNKNGTLLNWEPLARGAAAPLEHGDLIGVGQSLLLFRVPREERGGTNRISGLTTTIKRLSSQDE